MKNAEFFKREALNWLLLGLPVIYLLYVYDRLPPFAPIPLIWEQSIYYVLIFNIVLSVIWYLILTVKPAIVPRTTLHENPRSLHRIKTLVVCFISLLSLTYISQKTGIKFNWSKIGFLLAMAFVMIFGNLYPTIKSNFIIGIKNAWTLSDERVWNKTHRFAGRVYFLGGLIGVLFGLFVNTSSLPPFMPVIYVGYVFSLLLLTHIYSFVLFRKLH
jgi:uncharacterized membrane protein